MQMYIQRGAKINKIHREYLRNYNKFSNFADGLGTRLNHDDNNEKTKTQVTTFRRFATAAIAALTALSASAASDSEQPIGSDGENLLEFNVQARLDGQYVQDKGKSNQSQTGFMGKYIAIKAHGTIVDGLSYTWRQRFSRTPKDQTFWDQTDILDLTYRKGRFDVGAGKQVVMIGGFEYNRAPINLMCPNLFVSNVACYQFGISGGYQITPGDHIGLQFCQSLFANSANRNMYAINLMWSGSHDLSDRIRLETLWSLNEIEYQPGKGCNYIALGNKLVFDDRFSVTADIMTRTYPDNRFFKNNTFMAEFGYNLGSAWCFTGKVSYDCNLGVNQTPNSEVARGSELTIVGAVAEWMPLRKKRHMLKAHAACFYSFGKNMNSADLMQKNTLYAALGFTWQMNLFNIKK